MMRLIVPLIATVATICAAQAQEQGAFPAPLPGGSEKTSPFPPVTGTAPSASFSAPISSELDAACMKGFVPLRDNAQRLGRLIKEASVRKAPRDEACKLISSLREAELDMIRYVDANLARCRIPLSQAEKLKIGNAKTEEMQKKVCAVPGV
jgi:hypothetical protein